MPAKVAEAFEPRRLAKCRYDLARAYTTFYDLYPVVAADKPIRSNRIALCQLSAQTLEQGLGQLGMAPATDVILRPDARSYRRSVLADSPLLTKKFDVERAVKQWAPCRTGYCWYLTVDDSDLIELAADVRGRYQ
ncbi:DALR anticodon-binding domain-containing protein [Nocardia salmonicida]|uniref:DALR anticodon-binding domain-containing protein n=1 Tax=Nocardia salmonicida TaxID=53431 RepID=UPI002E2B97F7|nr:DALR anticodon-binding domain-containing protein [Nocardia salmonicida]